MRFPKNLPGGWEFIEPFSPNPLAKGQVWRKCGPSDAIQVIRVMQPRHSEYDGGIPGISVRSSQIGNQAVTWSKNSWFMPGTEEQLMKRLKDDGYALIK